MRKNYRGSCRISCMAEPGPCIDSPPLERVEASCVHCPESGIEILDLAGRVIEQGEAPEPLTDTLADPDDIVIDGPESEAIGATEDST